MRPRPAGLLLAVAAWLLVGCGSASTVAQQASPSAAVQTPTPTPVATAVFVPNAETYFPRIARFDFPTAPAAFINLLARSVGSSVGRQTFVSYTGRSVMHDGVQLQALVAGMVVVPDLYAQTDTFAKLADANLAGIPGSTGRPLTIGSLALPAMEITMADAKGYAVIYQQGFFFVQVVGSDPKLLLQIAEVLVEANARRQP